MQLILLGFVFMVGLLVYYFFSTTASGDSKDKDKGKNKDKLDNKDNDLKKDKNVIFLPSDIEKEKENHKKNK